jgi:hypothetical protein
MITISRNNCNENLESSATMRKQRNFLQKIKKQNMKRYVTREKKAFM